MARVRTATGPGPGASPRPSRRATSHPRHVPWPPSGAERDGVGLLGIGPAPGDGRARPGSRRARRRPPTRAKTAVRSGSTPKPVSRPRPVPSRRQNVRPSVCRQPAAGRWRDGPAPARPALVAPAPGGTRRPWCPASPDIARRGRGDRGNRTGRRPHGGRSATCWARCRWPSWWPGPGAWTSGRWAIATPATGTPRSRWGAGPPSRSSSGDVAKGALAAARRPRARRAVVGRLRRGGGGDGGARLAASSPGSAADGRC